MAELERCLDFLRLLDRQAAAREVRFRFGTAYLHDSVPRIWSRNYLRAEENLAEATAEQLAAEADRVLGEAGIAHRKVEVYDGEVGARLEPGFRALGWETECDVVMVAKREPDRDTDAALAEEVSLEDLVSVWAEAARGDRHVEDEDVVRQLAEGKRILMSAIDTRFFAARAEGEIGSYCELYSGAGTGQVENVLTLERYRNRGLARATVSLALAESRAAGNDLTFLLADRDDWPKELYRKLGFDEVGFVYDFVRPARA
jgi:ribosomal protein S18 acetylase RimI-like enzyme